MMNVMGGYISERSIPEAKSPTTANDYTCISQGTTGYLMQFIVKYTFRDWDPSKPLLAPTPTP